MASSSPRNKIEEFVEKTIEDHQVVIFSKSWCGYCRKVKNLFQEHFESVKPEIVELDKHEEGTAIQAYLAKRTGQSTVPNVFVNQKHIGGADKTKIALDNNTLAEYLKVSEDPQAEVESTRQA